MSFDGPWWLLTLPVLAAPVVLVHQAGIAAVGPRQRRLALALRLTIVTLLVLALAGMRVRLGGNDLSVVFVVDRSDSVGPQGAERALDFINEALNHKRRDDRAAVVAFGREPRLEFGLTESPAIDQITALPDPGATDAARALQLAAALFGSGELRRVVLLTDGRETHGDARRQASALARRGIVVEGETISSPDGSDTLIESIDAPASVPKGAAYRLGITVRSPGGPAVIELYRDGMRIARRSLTLPYGRSTIGFDQRAGAPGLRKYDARVSAVADPVLQNDRATAGVIVEGPPRVLVVHEGPAREIRSLRRALLAGQITSDVTPPPAIPDIDGLLRYQAVLLVDVPAFRVGPDAVERLRAAVVDAGLGLITIGGDSSYGLGGYVGSPLEEVLPVDSELTDPERRPPIAQALIIDTSGSMGFENGINKTDLSRAGAAGAIASLRETDTVGVLTFNTNSAWLLPLQKRPTDDEVRDALARMTPEGGTEIGQAVQRAADDLAGIDATLKHMILFTDGHADDSRLLRIAADAKGRGITLSIVAIGQSPATILPQMAVSGGGRYYEGTNLSDVPEIITEEAILASRNYINEGRFLPVITADTELTRRTTAAPPLRGYVATTAKPTAITELAIGEEHDPLLAQWRAGLGVVASWTSDAYARWSRAWVGWAGFRDFWTALVRSTFPGGGAADIALDARVTGQQLRIRIEAARGLGAGAEVTTHVLDPNLDARDVTLARVGPGRFEAIVPTTAEGIYAVTGMVREAGVTRFRGTVTATLPYSAEYLEADADHSLIADLAEVTGGRSSLAPSEAFDRNGLKAEHASRELWPVLTLLVAILLPVDIAARRLIITREDVRKARGAIRRRRTPEGGPTERVQRLMRAKRRATRR